MRFLSTCVHGAIGYRAGALLIISPWLFGFATLVWLQDLVSGLFEGAASLTTQTVPGAGTRQQGLGAGA